MDVIKVILAGVFIVAGFVGWIIILIEMFRDEIWKGILGLLCWLYMLYYAIFDFEHENKWIIVLLWFGGHAIAVGILNL